jgi:hypothetical protein
MLPMDRPRVDPGAGATGRRRHAAAMSRASRRMPVLSP